MMFSHNKFIFMYQYVGGAGEHDADLTGGEDPVVLHAVVSALPVVQAYKEGERWYSKFL